MRLAQIIKNTTVEAAMTEFQIRGEQGEGIPTQQAPYKSVNDVTTFATLPISEFIIAIVNLRNLFLI